METAQVHCERQEQVGAQFLRKHEGPRWPARADPVEFWDPALTLPGLTVDSGHPLWLVPPTPPAVTSLLMGHVLVWGQVRCTPLTVILCPQGQERDIFRNTT